MERGERVGEGRGYTKRVPRGGSRERIDQSKKRREREKKEMKKERRGVRLRWKLH